MFPQGNKTPNNTFKPTPASRDVYRALSRTGTFVRRSLADASGSVSQHINFELAELSNSFLRSALRLRSLDLPRTACLGRASATESAHPEVRMRKLASIQSVNAVEPIPNAEAIEKIRVLGWWVVVKAIIVCLGWTTAAS